MKTLLLTSAIFLAAITAKAQDITKAAETPLTISGSVDAYYKYDFPLAERGWSSEAMTG